VSRERELFPVQLRTCQHLLAQAGLRRANGIKTGIARGNQSLNRNGWGVAIYGNSFSARSTFMEYVREFEPRLADANMV
jgi:hypothetical protein